MEGDDRLSDDDVFRVANWYFVTLLIEEDGGVGDEKAVATFWLNEAEASAATPIRR